MGEVNNWSPAAANNGFPPPDGAPEGSTTLGSLNNIQREMMAVVSRWFRDTSGELAATNSGNNYNLVTARSTPAYFVGLRLRFRIPVVNTGPATLQVNGLGFRQIVWPDGSSLRANDLPDVVDVYYHGGGNFVLDNQSRRQPGEFSPGTVLTFGQAAPPVGWTQLTGWDDRMIRLVAGAGGGVGGSWPISGLSVESQNHTHAVTSTGTTGAPSGVSAGFEFGAAANAAANNHVHSVTVTGTTAGVSQNHTHTGDGSWRPAYANWIVAARN